jgi:hypothetical protein
MDEIAHARHVDHAAPILQSVYQARQLGDHFGALMNANRVSSADHTLLATASRARIDKSRRGLDDPPQ